MRPDPSELVTNKLVTNAGPNCGVGDGGFLPGNHCARGVGGRDPVTSVSATGQETRSTGGKSGQTKAQHDYPHLAHLLNGAEVHSTAGSKGAATDAAKALRAKGVFASVIPDPRGRGDKKFLVTTVARTTNARHDPAEVIDNCGGKGGRPGPCPVGTDPHSGLSADAARHGSASVKLHAGQKLTETEAKDHLGGGMALTQSRLKTVLENKLGVTGEAADAVVAKMRPTGTLKRAGKTLKTYDPVDLARHAGVLATNCGGKGGKPGPCPGFGGTASERRLAAASASTRAASLSLEADRVGRDPDVFAASEVARKAARLAQAGTGFSGGTSGHHARAERAHHKASVLHARAGFTATSAESRTAHLKASDAHTKASFAHRDAAQSLKLVGNAVPKTTTTNKEDEVIDGMVTLAVNAVGTVRTEYLHGREYKVVPMTTIVPGVLNGSKGPLLYPEDEIGREVDAWNGMPIVAYHPVKDGRPVTARRPDVLRESQLGTVFESKFDGKLTHEAWFDAVLTKNYDNKLVRQGKGDAQVYPRLVAGRPIELSTGLRTTNHPVPPGTVHADGRPYTHVARNYRPDHLAVLPDQTGACSLKDGCGVLVNAGPAPDEVIDPDPTPTTNATTGADMTRKEAVDYLITNCECSGWQEKDRDTLMNGADAPFLKAQVRLTENAVEEMVANSVEGTDDEDDKTPAANAMPPKGKKMKGKAKAGCEDDDETTNAEDRPLTMKEWDAIAKRLPKQITQNLAHAGEIVDREKGALVKQLVANVSDPKRKAALAEKYMDKDLAELRELTELMPKRVPQTNNPDRDDETSTRNRRLAFAGIGGFDPAPTRNAQAEEPMPEIGLNNYDEWADDTVTDPDADEQI